MLHTVSLVCCISSSWYNDLIVATPQLAQFCTCNTVAQSDALASPVALPPHLGQGVTNFFGSSVAINKEYFVHTSLLVARMQV